MRKLALAIAAFTLSGCVVAAPGPNQLGGGLAGAGAGALIGAQIGAGTGNLAAIGAGAALGAMLGGSLGESVDRANAAGYYSYYSYVPPPNPYAYPRPFSPPPRYYSY
jgi:surface antigen